MLPMLLVSTLVEVCMFQDLSVAGSCGPEWTSRWKSSLLPRAFFVEALEPGIQLVMVPDTAS